MGGGAGIQGAVHVGGLIYGATTLNIAGAAQINSLISNGAITGTTVTGTAGTFTSLQVSGTTTTNALVSNVYGLFGQLGAGPSPPNWNALSTCVRVVSFFPYAEVRANS